jgi:hypothetical protein
MKKIFCGDSITDFFPRYPNEDSYRTGLKGDSTMKKRVFSTLLLLSMFIALTMGNAFAYNDSPITVKVPFDFVVGKKTLPAGEYTVRENAASGPNATLLIQNTRTKVAVITGTQPFQPKAGKNKPKLEFTQYQGQYFLRHVIMPESQYGRAIRLRKSQAEVAKVAVESVSVQN